MASPSKNQNYAYLSRLSTQKLLELLAAAPAPAETPEDKAYIDAIVEVVLEREERHPTGLLPDPEQAWEEFQQYYNTPEGEDLSLYPAENPGTAPSEPAPSQTEYRPQRRPKRHFFRRVVIVAAVVVCIALPSALGFENVFQLIGAWTDDIFLLNNVSSLEGNEIEADKKSVDIEEILGELNYSENIFPTWIPEGFELEKVITNEFVLSGKTELRIHYKNGQTRELITFTYNVYNSIASGTMTAFEKDANALEEYFVGDVTHYIFENLGKYIAVWNQNNIECAISGDVSLTELKEMLNSIYGG
ncbi:DUF4367 domain-containing protein [Flavonifractor plautii]|uniref:DUF4367 domain-containing protein n=1 Tax=Flavonifractor plautii TaxID=292800 RepID=UPI0024BBBF53|nr:DUF4367 domain-containing protein [Flavonifractor plautii]